MRIEKINNKKINKSSTLILKVIRYVAVPITTINLKNIQ